MIPRALTFLLVLLCAACSGSMQTPDGGTGGGAGGGTGSSLVLATQLTPAAAGTLSGSATAPAGYAIDGTIAIACKRLGDECDTVGTVSVAFQGTGQTGTFALTGLMDVDYAVLAFKDVNNSGDVEAGDVVGAWLDASGELIWTRPGFAGSPMELAVIPPDTQGPGPTDAGSGTVTPTPLPAALVGSWTTVSSSSATGYEFRADGTYTYAAYFRFTVQSGCTRNGLYTPPYVFTYRTGVASVQGNSITLEDRGGIYQRDVNCTKTVEPAVLTNRAATFAAITDATGSPALRFQFTDSTEPVEYRKDTAIPANPAP